MVGVARGEHRPDLVELVLQVGPHPGGRLLRPAPPGLRQRPEEGAHAAVTVEPLGGRELCYLLLMAELEEQVTHWFGLLIVEPQSPECDFIGCPLPSLSIFPALERLVEILEHPRPGEPTLRLRLRFRDLAGFEHSRAGGEWGPGVGGDRDLQARQLRAGELVEPLTLLLIDRHALQAEIQGRPHDAPVVVAVDVPEPGTDDPLLVAPRQCQGVAGVLPAVPQELCPVRPPPNYSPPLSANIFLRLLLPEDGAEVAASAVGERVAVARVEEMMLRHAVEAPAVNGEPVAAKEIAVEEAVPGDLHQLA